jgi:hypothetical protein
MNAGVSLMATSLIAATPSSASQAPNKLFLNIDEAMRVEIDGETALGGYGIDRSWHVRCRCPCASVNRRLAIASLKR